jgi:hypothetical protein
MRSLRSLLALAALAPLGLQAQDGASPSAREGMDFFEKRIRPVLSDRCYKCHSGDKVKAELSLDSREGLLRGGESGPAVVPGDPEKSLLIHAIRHGDDDLDMPPKQAEWLTTEQIRDFESWVRMGAPDPRLSAAVKPPVKASINFVEGRKFWSYHSVSDPALPAVRETSWVRNAVDRFVLAKLEEKRLPHAADADRRTLLRRATFDLIGLPPTPEEMRAFLEDSSPDAFAKVVERLLASPQYGERWGRHWLDVVRYADTAGCNSDYPIPQMYKYRNYVIASFNADKPFDQFIREQIAGDLLPAATEAERHEKIIATGYLAATRRFASSEAGTQHLIIDDTIDNLGKAFLGLSIGCARCHDHKFDAVSNEDYYALYGIFSSTRYPFPGIELNKVPRDLVPLIPQEKVDEILKPYKDRLAVLDAAVKQLEDEKAVNEKIVREADEAKRAEAPKAKAAPPKAPGGSPADSSADALAKADPELRRKFEELSAAQAQARKTREFIDSEIERLEGEKAALLRSSAENEQAKNVAQARKRLEEYKNEHKAALKKREDFAKTLPVIESAYAVAEGPKPDNAKMLIRGEPKNLGPEIPRRFLDVLGGQALPADEKGSGRRQLAEWIADRSNPLPARVLVNRIWQHHFGKGIVQTPNDFGVRGAPPTHPELLDYLTRRFLDGGLSIKALHRLILASRTYQMASEGPAENAKVDPNNDWLWKFSRRRLDGEEIRDAMLAVSGALDRTVGGEHPFPPRNTWNFTQHRPFIDVYETDRRSVYVMTQRIRRHPFFALFDGPDTNASTGARGTSTTPLQALFMMNDPFVHAQAKKFAARLLGERADDASRVERAWELAFGRSPSSPERQEAERFLVRVREALKRNGTADGETSTQAWESYARVVLRTNEFIYVD